MAKEGLTVKLHVCCSLSGEKIKPLVTGMAENPQCINLICLFIGNPTKIVDDLIYI